MAHGVDPAVKEVETPDLEAILDRARTEAKFDELRERHHAVLPRRQFGQFRVGCAELGLTMRLNIAHPVYVGASRRQTGAPRALRHTLNAQFVTKRVQVVEDAGWGGAAGTPTGPGPSFGFREASATPPRINPSPPIDAAVIGSSSSSAP